MGDGSRFSPEVKEGAVRLVFEQVKNKGPTWPIIVSVATKIGCTPRRSGSGYGRPSETPGSAKG
jgi:transposase-like protein